MTERDRLIDLIVSADISLFGSDKPYAEVYADFLLANGVIVPPCKVGDTVYIHWSLTKGHKVRIYPAKVYALRWDTKKNSMRICVNGEFKMTEYGGKYNHHYNGTFAWNSVGKTVFLTKEEAEQFVTDTNVAYKTKGNERKRKETKGKE